MNWGFLSEFWDLLTSVGGYAKEYFQNIGIAVAGAIGSFFDAIFHNLNDIFVFFAWLGVALKTIFLSIASPLLYFFNVLRWFFSTAFQNLPEPELIPVFAEEVLEVFNTIPHWELIGTILGSIVLLFVGIATLKLLLKT